MAKRKQEFNTDDVRCNTGASTVTQAILQLLAVTFADAEQLGC